MKLVYDNIGKQDDGSASNNSDLFGLPKSEVNLRMELMESGQQAPESPADTPSLTDSEDLDCFSDSSGTPVPEHDEVFLSPSEDCTSSQWGTPPQQQQGLLISGTPWEPYRVAPMHQACVSTRNRPSRRHDKPHVQKMCTNRRERFRNHNINGAYADLRRLVPTHPPDKKLSKNEILRLAIKYIKLLSSILEYEKNNESSLEESTNANKKKVPEEFTTILRRDSIKSEPQNDEMCHDGVSEASSPASSLSSVSSHTDGQEERTF